MTPEEVAQVALKALYDAMGTPPDQYQGLKRRIRTTAHPDNESHGGGGPHKHEAKVTLE